MQVDCQTPNSKTITKQNTLPSVHTAEAHKPHEQTMHLLIFEQLPLICMSEQ